MLSISPTLSGQPLSDPLDMVITGENVKSWHTDWMYQDVEAPGGGVGDERRVLFMERNRLGESSIQQRKRRNKYRPPVMTEETEAGAESTSGDRAAESFLILKRKQTSRARKQREPRTGSAQGGM